MKILIKLSFSKNLVFSLFSETVENKTFCKTEKDALWNSLQSGKFQNSISNFNSVVIDDEIEN